VQCTHEAWSLQPRPRVREKQRGAQGKAAQSRLCTYAEAASRTHGRVEPAEGREVGEPRDDSAGSCQPLCQHRSMLVPTGSVLENLLARTTVQLLLL
jgi:hypothetical protein